MTTMPPATSGTRTIQRMRSIAPVIAAFEAASRTRFSATSRSSSATMGISWDW
jgi:hypothetical protein